MTRARLADGLLVVAVVALPAAFYVGGLGFYLDDHYWLGLMANSDDKSVPGLFETLAGDDPKAWLRPVMYLLLTAAYSVFGGHAWAYHVLVVALVAACALLVHALLSRLGAPRFLALGVPLLFAAAPHYSSDRFWLASYAAPASLALSLAGIYAYVRGSASRGPRLGAWLVGGSVALGLGVFMYEITLPLFVVAVAFLWHRSRAAGGSLRLTARVAALSLVAVLIAKGVATELAGGGTSHQLGYQSGFLHHMGYLVSGGVKVNFGTYGIGLPYVIGWIATHHLTWSAALASLLVGSLLFLYLAHAGELELPPARLANGRRPWRYIVAGGLALLVVGYGSFVVTDVIYFTSAGIDNRVNIVAAIGVAMLAVGLVLRGLELLPEARRQGAFAFAVALLAAIGVFVTNTLADYWRAASAEQETVLADLRRDLPAELEGMTVVLDGVCPEVGPGIVFTAHYDLAGALQRLYHEPTITAPVATAAMSAEARSLVISTLLFDTSEPRRYRYGPHLLVYDARTRTSHLLTGRAEARRYLAASPRPSCPPLRSFSWGIPTSRLVPFVQGGVGVSAAADRGAGRPRDFPAAASPVGMPRRVAGHARAAAQS